MASSSMVRYLLILTDRMEEQEVGINLDKPNKWKADIALSVDMYNDWFMRFAPEAFRSTRIQTTGDVENTIRITNNYKTLTSDIIYENPKILPALRMSTCPPIAIDRLIGLSGVKSSIIKRIENDGKLPLRITRKECILALMPAVTIIQKLLDQDIFTWILENRDPQTEEIHRAATIVADRLCGSVANPIIRNAQEKRQLTLIKKWLEAKGYIYLLDMASRTIHEMNPGTFAFHVNVPANLNGAENSVNITVDVAVMRRSAIKGEMPLLLEAKSAGDFTNVNKRRKEEATKMAQLKNTYGEKINYTLFLCGYFDCGYLGYEAAEGIDWVWEHRIDELAEYGL